MELKLFTDLFDAVEKTINALKKISNLPKEIRDELRSMFDETFKLLDTTINMIIIRLVEILKIENENDFKSEIALLTYEDSWIKAEREFRLCKGLRHVVDESWRLKVRIVNHISVSDWDNMRDQMNKILQGEDRLGIYITQKFQDFSMATPNDDLQILQTKETLKEFLKGLNDERRKLLQIERDLYDNF